jgi:hypothetical protein
MTYWDSSALLNALASIQVLERLKVGQHVSCSHAFVEAFHHLTGRGLPHSSGIRTKVSANQGAKALRALAAKFSIKDLDSQDMLQALDDAQDAGVMGRAIHDWMHARSAKLAGCSLLLTRDGDLEPLCRFEGLKMEWP